MPRPTSTKKYGLWSVLVLLANLSVFLIQCTAPKSTETCTRTSDCVEIHGTGYRCIAGTCRKYEVRNEAPVADPGVFQRVRQNSEVKLDGSKSRDPEGGPVTYAWTLAKKPQGSQAELVGADTATPTFTADAAGDFVVQLIVKDDKELASQPRQVTIEVFGAEENGSPVANAGQDQIAGVGIEVKFDGSGSTDPEGDTLTFAWGIKSKPQGSQAELVGADTDKPTLTPDVAGKYIIELVVSDGLEASQPATVSIEALGDYDLQPTITEITPDNGFADTNAKVAVKGTGFSPQLRIFFDGRVQPVDNIRFVSATELEWTLSLSARSPGKYKVKVVNPNRKESAEVDFEVRELPTPEITSIDPSTAPTGSKLDSLRVVGKGFVDKTEVLFESVPVPTTYVSSTEITFKLDLVGVNPGKYTLRLRNPGGRTSGTADFVVTEPLPPPILNVLNPPRAITGQKLAFSIHGTGFSQNAVIVFDGKPIPSNRLRREEIQATPELDLTNIPAGTYKVWAQNVDGQISDKLDFVVEGVDPTPRLDRILPFFVYLDDSTNKVAIYGDSFRPGAQVEIDGKLLPTTDVSFQSTTYIEALVDTTKGTWTPKLKADAVVINPGNKRSNVFPIDITYRIPSVSSITPTRWRNACSTEVLIKGINFLQGKSEVHFGTNIYKQGVVGAYALTFVDDRTLKFTLASGLTAQTYSIFVRNGPNADSAKTNFSLLSGTSTYTAKIRAAQPNSGQSDTKVTVALNYETGFTFDVGAIVLFNGKAVPSVCSSTSSCYTLSAELDLAGVAPGEHDLQVVNPCGTPSVVYKFVVLDPPTPSITQVSPSNALVGDKFYLSIQGSNFLPNSALYFGTQKLDVVLRSDKDLITKDRIDLTGKTPGTVDLYVDNQNGQKTQKVKFSIMAANSTLRISNVSQTSFKRGISYNGLSVTGSGFTQNSEAYFNGKKVTLKYLSAAQVTVDGLDFNAIPAGVYYLYIQDGTNKSNEFPLFAEAEPPPIMDHLSPATEYVGRSFTFYVYGSRFCTPNGTTCQTNPIIRILDAQGNDYGSDSTTNKKYTITRSYIYSSSQYVYGTLNTGGMSAGNYKVYFELPTGERSNPAVLQLQELPDPVIDRLTWSPSGTVYPDRVFTYLAVYGKYYRTPPPDPEFLVDGQPYKSSPPTPPRCFGSSPTYTYCYLDKFTTAGLAAGSHTIQYKTTINGKVWLSNAFSFTVTKPPAPTVTSISPNAGSQGTMIQVTIRGSNLANGAFVLGSNLQVIPTLYVSTSELHMTMDTTNLPLGSSQFVLQNPDGQQSAAFTFSVIPKVPPMITYSSPDVINPGTSSLTIYGMGIEATDTVSIDGQTVSAAFRTGSEPNFYVAGHSFPVKTGPYMIQITKADGTKSNVFELGNNEGKPHIRYLSPRYVNSGSSATIYAYSYHLGSSGVEMRINGVLQTGGYLSSTSYIRSASSGFKAPTVTVPTEYTVEVKNPNGKTDTDKFYVIPSTGPYITSFYIQYFSDGMEKLDGAASGTTGIWYVAGSRFTSTSKIHINGVEVPTRYSSSTRLYLSAPYSLSGKSGRIPVKVVDGALSSNTMYINMQSGHNLIERPRSVALEPFWSYPSKTLDVEVYVLPWSTTYSQPFGAQYTYQNWKSYEVLVKGPGLATPKTYSFVSCAGTSSTTDPRRCKISIDTTGWQVGVFSFQVRHKTTLETSGGTGFAVVQP
ncbi:MAG: IPT/TIG domain-containing protein [Myxococcales bacterium]|nr:IPT/TIG domain-containing protein [Myxococcales bacterium]